ncbi:MAG TPA: hypothetical protein VN920_12590, partial [Pyrinomonadaceae bacterium]|nr:hypothetical protein [Pyrinomonadaceae bacterium]
ESCRIELNDFVIDRLKSAMAALSLEHFPTSTPVTGAALAARLKGYEDAVSDLLVIVILLAKWGRAGQLQSLNKVFNQLSFVDKGSGGTVLWLRLGWYPIQMLAYAAGISALESENYAALSTILLAPCHYPHSPTGETTMPLVCRMSDEMSQIGDFFKQLPGHDRQFVPRSEYLFGLLREPIDRELFIGANYESLFDRFEVIGALIYADLTVEKRGGIWGPIGRFGYKYRRGAGGPYEEVTKELTAQKNNWPILKVGFFGGKSDRALEIVNGLGERVSKIGWY